MKYLFVVFAALAMIGCTEEPTRSDTLLQAEKVHEESIAVYGQALEDLQIKSDQLTAVMQTVMEGDDHEAMNDVKQKMVDLEQIAAALRAWDENLIEIPGHAHVHEDGEVCTHDHAEDALLEGLTDEDLLKLQSDQQAELRALTDQLAGIEVPA